MEFEQMIEQVIDAIWLFLPLVLPIGLGILLFRLWVEYAQSKFLSEQKYSLLRVVPPKEVTKTPAAMELFINALYQTVGEANPIQKYWKGSMRPWYSLEIVSNGGEVGFYIWARSGSVNYLSSQIYAQYPGIEVTEVEDYTDTVDYSSGEYNMFGVEYKLTEPDPVPIKTYVDYGLDRPSEETEKVDPLTATTEFMGSLRNGEHAWLQIIVKAHIKEDKKGGTWFGKTDSWVDESKEMIIDLKKKSIYKDPDDPEAPPINLQTNAIKEKIDAIERNVAKLGFDVGIRGIYIAKKDVFDGANIGGLLGSFKQYGSANLNGFKPAITTGVKYPWYDPLKKIVPAMKEQMFEDYKARRYFGTYIGLKARQKFILNTEELATIFHFPGGVAATPTLTRVSSRKGEAPTNLPIQ